MDLAAEQMWRWSVVFVSYAYGSQHLLASLDVGVFGVVFFLRLL
jgi:hypothetical protein